MALASVADVERYYGAVPAELVGRATDLLEDAEELVAQKVPDLDARITAGRTSARLVTQVLGEMVAAVLRNPEGLRSTANTETVGPFSKTESGTYSSASSGLLEVTPRHLRMLGKPRGAVTVPAADPALRRPFRDPGTLGRGAGVPEGVPYGNVWPEPWDGVWR